MIRALLLIFLLTRAIPACAQSTAKDSPERQLEVIFDASASGALFSTVSGKWGKLVKGGNSMIQLNGEPVVESRVEMGPYLRNNEVVMSAKVKGRAKAGLKPRMGVGVYGKNGFFLRLAPARDMVEIAQYGEVIAEAPYEWDPEKWHHLELTIVVATEKTHWVVSGKAWPDDGEKPEVPVVVHRATLASLIFPLAGKAFLTGSPYNGYPILFDDAVLKKIKPPPPPKEDGQDENKEKVEEGEEKDKE